MGNRSSKLIGMIFDSFMMEQILKCVERLKNYLQKVHSCETLNLYITMLKFKKAQMDKSDLYFPWNFNVSILSDVLRDDWEGPFSFIADLFLIKWHTLFALRMKFYNEIIRDLSLNSIHASIRRSLRNVGHGSIFNQHFEKSIFGSLPMNRFARSDLHLALWYFQTI